VLTFGEIDVGGPVLGSILTLNREKPKLILDLKYIYIKTGIRILLPDPVPQPQLTLIQIQPHINGLQILYSSVKTLF
jgi:hypothetical protein